MGFAGKSTPKHGTTSGEGEPKGTGVGIAAKVAGGLLGVLALSYLGGALWFSTHFMPKTSVGGRDVSLQSVDLLASTLGKELDAFETTVMGDGIDVTLSGSDIDARVDAAAYAKSACESQNAWAWPIEVFNTHSIDATLEATCDADKVRECLSDAVEAVNEEGTDPTDATVAYDMESDRFAIKAESYGTKVDEELLAKFVCDEIGQLKTSIEPGEESLVQPKVTADDEALAKGVENANKLLVGEIKLTFNGTEATSVTNERIASWVKLSDDGTAELDESAVAKWTKGDLSKELDTVGTKRSYKRPDGVSCTVSGGTYGWSIDGTKLASTICSRVKKGSDNAIEIPAAQSAQSWTTKGGQDWGDTYVDLSISEQHVRFYKKDKLAWESDCVTGNLADNHATPTGIYVVNSNKGTNQTLLGFDENGDGEPDYKSYVSYWIPFIDNAIAFHDASWRSSFGGDIYTYNGSHGCVNLPTDKAKSLYDICDVGTVVVVH